MRTTTVAGLSAIYVLAPQLPSTSSLLLLVIATGTSYGTWRPRPQGSNLTAGPALLTPALVAGVLLGVVAAAVTDFGATCHAVRTVVENDQVTLAVAGFTACVFIGGAFVAWVLAPFTTVLNDSDDAPGLHSLANAGRYIGWFERAILFAFVLGGEPQAAALALAAKSFARFPTLRQHHEGFAEYFLIGSLGSLAIALGAAFATRAAIGVSLLS
jgi:uncharacterized membrane protein